MNPGDPPGDRSADGVVFSKDRPMQLSATINSFLELVHGDYVLHVLYAASSEKYSVAYNQLINSTKSDRVYWYRETDFKADLIEVLSRVRAKHTFFLVDDIIVTHEFSISDFCPEGPETFVSSMRLGANLQRCYTANARQSLPSFKLLGENYLTFSWLDGTWDWTYPLSVDGHVFPTNEMRVLASILDYRAPNTFEGALQTFSSIYAARPGLCARQSRLVNIPHNRVQTENDNRSQGLSADQLLGSWYEGYRIDHRAFRGFQNTSAHEEAPLHLHRIKGNPTTDA